MPSMAHPINDRLGVCSWSLAAVDPDELARMFRQLDLPAVQLALIPLLEDGAVWSCAPQTLAQAGVRIASGMFGTVGEDYSSIDAIRRTGGIVPDATWDATWQRVRQVAPLAARLKLTLVTFHAGFIPEDANDPLYQRALERMERIAELFADYGIDLGLETGQENAATLKSFLETLNRPNVGVNFDPANLILYNSGDPIESVKLLMSHLKQVHIKDAVRTTTPGAWGREVVVGTGEVDWGAFAVALGAGGYHGDLVIEREAGAQRMDDIRAARDHVRATW